MLTITILLFFVSDSVWLNVKNGNVLYLNPSNIEWVPIAKKEKINRKSYIISKSKTEFAIYYETDVYELKGEMKFFINDLFKRNKKELLLELTRIESEQLKSFPVNNKKRERLIGKLYGNSVSNRTNNLDISLYINAIDYFIKEGWYSAALLAQKRLFSRFPTLYKNREHINRLLQLYKKFEFKGFIYDETKRIETINDNVEILEISKKYKTN